MDNSVYVALSKQTGLRSHMELIANNIANTNTTGYQAEKMLFRSFLEDDIRGDTAYVQDYATVRDTRPGFFEQTGSQLDFAINGPGYFAIETPQGLAYTKSGSFTIDTDGALATADGHKVLDDAGAPIEFEQDDAVITVYASGRMEVDGEERSALGVYHFSNEQRMTRTAGNLFVSNENPRINEGESLVAQGVLEKSNVQSILEMTDMITVQRSYTGVAKFIDTMYELQENSVRTLSRQA